MINLICVICKFEFVVSIEDYEQYLFLCIRCPKCGCSTAIPEGK